jgi:16S rRNA C967 or C1407 C5-methylase (RsmB/RsmF family)
LTILTDPKLNSNVIQMPSGFVIANEIDVSRCDKLTQNLMEFSSPCSILVNHDGQDFPDFLDGNNKPVKYDRIVCDVPCSGDGTIRKNPNIWHGWHPGKGNGRHLLQYNIIERGVELLDIGGVLAYSSCSMNPVENEAVLARYTNWS